VNEGQVGRTGVPHLARPGYFRENLDADLERRTADTIQRRLERDDFVRVDGGEEVHGVQAGRHDEAAAVAHGEDAPHLVDVHEELAGKHGVPEQRVLGQHRAGGLERPARLLLPLVAGVEGNRPAPSEALETLAPTLSRLGEERLFPRPSRHQRGRHGHGLQILVHLDEDQVGVEGQGPATALDVLGEDPDSDLDRAAPDGLDLSPQEGNLPYLDRVEEVDVVHGPQDDPAARHASGCHGPHRGDPLHHAAAVDLPGRSRVLGEHPLDHLGDGIADREHVVGARAA
jgi:hypothetical protein